MALFFKKIKFHCSLLVYRKAICFDMLTFYLSLLLSSHTCSRGVFVDCFKFTTLMIVPSANKDTCMSLFPIYIHLNSFSCIIVLLRASRMMLKAMMRGDIIALSMILVEKILSFHN